MIHYNKCNECGYEWQEEIKQTICEPCWHDLYDTWH